jgi:hypothetical protein
MAVKKEKAKTQPAVEKIEKEEPKKKRKSLADFGFLQLMFDFYNSPVTLEKTRKMTRPQLIL